MKLSDRNTRKFRHTKTPIKSVVPRFVVLAPKGQFQLGFPKKILSFLVSRESLKQAFRIRSLRRITDRRIGKDQLIDSRPVSGDWRINRRSALGIGREFLGPGLR